VYFAEATHEAIDFALMVGDAGGTGDNAPHVYLFQCKALTTKNVTQGTEDEERRRDTWPRLSTSCKRNSSCCFRTDFAATHVWRRAGINSAQASDAVCRRDQLERQTSSSEKLNAPFNIVLFDKATTFARWAARRFATHIFSAICKR
jgi:hypothetical protein